MSAKILPKDARDGWHVVQPVSARLGVDGLQGDAAGDHARVVRHLDVQPRPDNGVVVHRIAVLIRRADLEEVVYQRDGILHSTTTVASAYGTAQYEYNVVWYDNLISPGITSRTSTWL
eukprot:scaffold68375_cov20-Prasinocladus_malaysianus.AAC.1